jgi:Xaa-Pro dipeptidase
MVITVEPGVYFIDALLLPAMKDEKVNKYLNVEKIAKFMNFGGVRIEDDVVVTADGMENLTLCPRTVEDIERVMQTKDAKKFEEKIFS